eukprot:SAG31_NODE_1458_length_8257_cov_10.274209_1_plen_289_part_00
MAKGLTQFLADNPHCEVYVNQDNASAGLNQAYICTNCGSVFARACELGNHRRKCEAAAGEEQPAEEEDVQYTHKPSGEGSDTAIKREHHDAMSPTVTEMSPTATDTSPMTESELRGSNGTEMHQADAGDEEQDSTPATIFEKRRPGVIEDADARKALTDKIIALFDGLLAAPEELLSEDLPGHTLATYQLSEHESHEKVDGRFHRFGPWVGRRVLAAEPAATGTEGSQNPTKSGAKSGVVSGWQVIPIHPNSSQFIPIHPNSSQLINPHPVWYLDDSPSMAMRRRSGS